MSKTILVFGGNGFVGSAICKYALSQNINVISISRSGQPRNPAPWQSSIQYVKGDALSPSTYTHLLPSVSGIIHSVGVLFDSNFPSTSTKVYEGSYQQMNRDSAISVIDQIGDKNIHFTYLSSERGIFFAPGYINTKREVEQYLENGKDRVGFSVIRPGFMYTDEVPKLKLISKGIDLLNFPDKFYEKIGFDWVRKNFIPAKSLDVNIVGKVAVQSLFDPTLKNRTLNVEEILNQSHNY